MPERPTSLFARWHFAAAVAAWLLPGLGHFLLGDRARGLVIAGGVGGLWTLGLLIGGVSVIEMRSPPGYDQARTYQFQPWFLGQMLMAPSLAVERYHMELRRDYGDRPPPPPEPGDPPPPYVPAFGRTQELGMLYTALAGVLNLLAIVDVIYRMPHRDADEGAAADSPPPPEKEPTP